MKPAMTRKSRRLWPLIGQVIGEGLAALRRFPQAALECGFKLPVLRPPLWVVGFAAVQIGHVGVVIISKLSDGPPPPPPAG